MPLLDHLIELRRRMLYCVVMLVVSFFFCFFFAQDLYDFLAQPLARALGEGKRMIFTDLTEVFFTQVKVALFFSFFLSFPLLAIQLWKFIAPGLYHNEKGAMMPFLVATPVFFIGGASFAYYGVFPLAWEFFLSFEVPVGVASIPIELEAKVGEYLSLVMRLVLAFGICFELPVATTLLVRAGIITPQDLISKRRYAIVGVFIIAAILTPPDPLSQILLAIPIILLYELSIILARFFMPQES